MIRSLLALLILFGGATARAANPGATAAPILQVPLGARAASMGSAFTAVADDLSTLFYNPAGLSSLDHKEFTFMYQRGIEGQNLEYIAAGMPVPFSGLIGEGHTSIATSLLFSQNGSIEVNRTNPDGSFLSSERVNAGGDLVWTISYAERAASMEFRRGRERYRMEHVLGISAKVIRSSLAGQYSATAIAADLGYHLKLPDHGVRYGLALLNLGTRMRFVEAADPLPMTLRAGLAYNPRISDRFGIGPGQALTLATDVDFLTFQKQWHVNLGVEYIPAKKYAIRIGYRINEDLAGLTFGLGADYRGMRIDYGWGLNRALSDIHKISMTFKFDKVPGYKREFRRRPYIESMPDREELRDIEEETPREIAPARRPRRRAPSQRRLAPGWIY